MTTESAIQIQGLFKSYGKFKALNGLDLHVARGETHGFLGPNGAGKSTTIRVLLGLLRADAGQTELLGGHIMSEVEALADRISIIRDGVIVETGTLDQMRQRTRTTVSAVLERAPAGLDRLPGVHDVHRAGERWVCSVEPDAMNATMT